MGARATEQTQAAPEANRWAVFSAHVMRQAKEVFCREVMKATGGNISAAARLAGMDRTNFKRLLRQIGER
jgi:transcriptional regulator of acetoin/glycerol metabolism